MASHCFGKVNWLRHQLACAYRSYSERRGYQISGYLLQTSYQVYTGTSSRKGQTCRKVGAQSHGSHLGRGSRVTERRLPVTLREHSYPTAPCKNVGLLCTTSHQHSAISSLVANGRKLRAL